MYWFAVETLYELLEELAKEEKKRKVADIRASKWRSMPKAHEKHYVKMSARDRIRFNLLKQNSPSLAAGGSLAQKSYLDLLLL
jgi:hypothetical protein